jgi:hypothetical protein
MVTSVGTAPMETLLLFVLKQDTEEASYQAFGKMGRLKLVIYWFWGMLESGPPRSILVME